MWLVIAGSVALAIGVVIQIRRRLRRKSTRVDNVTPGVLQQVLDMHGLPPLQAKPTSEGGMNFTYDQAALQSVTVLASGVDGEHEVLDVDR